MGRLLEICLSLLPIILWECWDYDLYHHTCFYMDSEGSVLGPHICSSSALPTKPHLSCFSYFCGTGRCTRPHTP